MARYRLSEPAKVDIAAILATSTRLHGAQARICYRALIVAALRRIASDPEGMSTIDRTEILDGIRSFHIRHSRNDTQEARVADPVHVIFYRASQRGPIEIVRVLHERMEPRGAHGLASTHR